MDNEPQTAIAKNDDYSQKFPGFFSLISETFALYKLKWVPLTKINLASYAFAAATIILVIALALLSGFAAAALSINYLFFIALVTLIVITGLCVLIYFSSWFSSALIIILRDSEEKIGFRESMKRAKPYVIPYIFVSVTAGLATMTGYFLFLIPGIILSVWLLPSVYIIFYGSERGFEAIAKSREYARNYFRKIFIVGLFGSIAMLILGSALDPLNNSALGKIINYLISFFIAPVYLIYPFLIFSHLRKIKGGSLAASSASFKNFIKALTGLGIIAIIVVVALLVYFAPRIKDYIGTYKQNTDATKNFQQLSPLPSI